MRKTASVPNFSQVNTNKYFVIDVKAFNFLKLLSNYHFETYSTVDFFTLYTETLHHSYPCLFRQAVKEAAQNGGVSNDSQLTLTTVWKCKIL